MVQSGTSCCSSESWLDHLDEDVDRVLSRASDLALNEYQHGVVTSGHLLYAAVQEDLGIASVCADAAVLPNCLIVWLGERNHRDQLPSLSYDDLIDNTAREPADTATEGSRFITPLARLLIRRLDGDRGLRRALTECDADIERLRKGLASVGRSQPRLIGGEPQIVRRGAAVAKIVAARPPA